MNVEYSIDDSDYLQNRLLKLQLQADMPDSIAGYQPKFIYNPRLLTVVSFENGNILGERSFWRDPQMTPGRIDNISTT